MQYRSLLLQAGRLGCRGSLRPVRRMTARLVVALALCLPGLAIAQGAVPATEAIAALRALHEKVMRAHRESNVELLLEDEDDDYVVANRGEISRPTLQQRRQRLGAYLEATRFTEYEDLTVPLVTVADDSSVGWVVAQVAARGRQVAANQQYVSIDFVSAWIELYERRSGTWRRIGNVSNFRP